MASPEPHKTRTTEPAAAYQVTATFAQGQRMAGAAQCIAPNVAGDPAQVSLTVSCGGQQPDSVSEFKDMNAAISGQSAAAPTSPNFAVLLSLEAVGQMLGITKTVNHLLENATAVLARTPPMSQM
ncbi:uncharacterized protein FFC1_05765 [Fusarium fujikuroi]|nr:uncharacterized protein FFC1_05765 [Fusarium fujikuroi]